MSSREIAELTDKRHDNVKRTIETCAESGVFTLPQIEEVSNSGFGPKTISVYQLDKRSSLIVVAQLSPEFTARIVDRWQELEAQATLSHRTICPLRDELEAVDVLARILNAAPSGKITMVKASLEHHGAKHLIAALPVYAIDAPSAADGTAPVSSMPTASLTELLKANGIAYNARTVNRMLIENGLLEELTRPSSKGGEKRFLSVTRKGAMYGKNVTSPSNAKETQPHWYRDNFSALCREIGIIICAAKA